MGMTTLAALPFWSKHIKARLIAWLRSRGVRAAVERAVSAAGDFVVGRIPGTIDDRVWEAIKRKYPSFSKVALTDHEVKLLALAIATEVVQQERPDIGTTDARSLAQFAYMERLSK